MTVAKTMEITAESPESFDAAIKKGVGRASETVKNLQGAWVKDQKCLIENGKITSYRVNMKVTFVLE
jgi:flavin-binding protein dodecin